MKSLRGGIFKRGLFQSKISNFAEFYFHMPVNFVIYFKKIQQTFMSIYEFTSQIFFHSGRWSDYESTFSIKNSPLIEAF